MPRIYLLLLYLLLSACTTAYVVRVDGIAGDAPPTGLKSYVIASNMQGIDTTDLYFREFSELLTPHLAALGLSPASDADHADLVIFLNYGISGGENVFYTRERPDYRLIGGETITWRETSTDSSGNRTVVIHDVHVPLQYHYMGVVTETAAAVVYTGFFSLEARAAGDEQTPPLWQLTVKCTSDHNDLRQLMPMMTRAAGPWFGRNTGRELRLTVVPDKTGDNKKNQ